MHGKRGAAGVLEVRQTIHDFLLRETLRESGSYPCACGVYGIQLAFYAIERQGGGSHSAVFPFAEGHGSVCHGIIAFHWRSRIAGKHILAATVFVLFAGFYSWFDRVGGFYGISSAPSETSPSPLRIFLPTIEAVWLAAF